MSEEFITMVAAMRDAQRDYFEDRTQPKLELCKRLETRVDRWLEKHTAELVQWELWNRAVQTDEMPGVYNVGHGTQAEEDPNG